MSPRKTDAEIEQLWQAHAWGGKHLEELREDHRRARASEATLLKALKLITFTDRAGRLRIGVTEDSDLTDEIGPAIAQAEGREP